MSKGDKFALVYILTTAAIGFGSVVYSLVAISKAEAAEKLEHEARFYAMKEVCRLLNEGKIRTQEDVDMEFEFAYMNYKSHH